MENNSIRRNLKREDIISEIRLLCGEDYKKVKTFVIVEGDDDLKFIKINLILMHMDSNRFRDVMALKKLLIIFRVIKELLGYEIKTIAF